MDMYRILKKVVHLLDRLEDMVGLLVCLVLFLIGPVCHGGQLAGLSSCQ